VKYFGLLLIGIAFLGCVRLLKDGRGKTFEERAEDIWMWTSAAALLLVGLMMIVFPD